MPWHLNGNAQVVCTAGCKHGFVPCLVDHASQPTNGEWQGEPYFRCETCDWVIPDQFNENAADLAGMTPCPECEGGDRADTFDGPCDYCNKKGRPAAVHAFPAELAYAAQKTFGQTGDIWCCDPCHEKFLPELRQEQERIDTARQEQAQENAARQAFLAEHGHKPVGTCDICGKRGYLDVVEPPDLFVCTYCSPTWTRPAQPELPPDEPADPDGYVSRHAADDQGNPPGWYNDPEHDGYVRWWSGGEWAGDPTLPEHCVS